MEDAFYSKNGNPKSLSYQLASCSWLSLEGQPKGAGMDTGGHCLSREEGCATIPSPRGSTSCFFFFQKKQVTRIFDKRVQYFKQCLNSREKGKEEKRRDRKMDGERERERTLTPTRPNGTWLGLATFCLKVPRKCRMYFCRCPVYCPLTALLSLLSRKR